VDNAVAAGLLGLLFGILYLRRGSLTGPIAAHAAYNLLTLAVYWTFVS
jgi:membrane protease YdiL (CAAX protease family)